MSNKPSTARQCQVFISSASLSLWAALTCKFLTSFAYMLCALTLRNYLQDNWGFSDFNAGLIYGIWGIMTTVFGILLSPIVDRVGVRYSLLLGTLLLSFSRFGLAFTLSTKMMLFYLVFLLPAGGSLGVPVIMISMRRYAISAVGTISYGLIFIVQCLGFFCSGMLVDIFRTAFPHSFGQLDINGTRIFNSTLPSQNRSVWLQMSAYRYIQLVSAIVNSTVFLIALFFIYDEEVIWVKNKNNKNQEIKPKMEKSPPLCLLPKSEERRDQNTIVRGSHIQTDKDLDKLLGKNNVGGGVRWEMQAYQEKPRGTTGELLSSLNVRQFWIFMLLVLSTLGVRMLLRQLDITFPVFAERELGKSVHYGAIVATNPFATIVFTLLSISICAKLSIIFGILVGMTVTAVAALWLTIEPALWTGYMFSITLALGEAIWVPRFIELSISKTAPEGQEALFSALVYAPTFFVKFLAGIVSGKLLETFVPAKGLGERNSRLMWAIFSAIALSSPLIVGILHYSCGLFNVLLDKITSANEHKAIYESENEVDSASQEQRANETFSSTEDESLLVREK